MRPCSYAAPGRNLIAERMLMMNGMRVQGRGVSQPDQQRRHRQRSASQLPPPLQAHHVPQQGLHGSTEEGQGTVRRASHLDVLVAAKQEQLELLLP